MRCANRACSAKHSSSQAPWYCQGPAAGAMVAFITSAISGTASMKKMVEAISRPKSGFAAGGKYRLSAWLKTERMAQPSAVNFGVFAAGLKSTGQGGHLPFPAAGAGWTRVSADFTVPAGAEMMRIMCNAAGEARAWVDDVTLEAVQADGSAKEVRYAGLSSDARFMRKWVALYHGEGRPWLAHGRLLHPPKLACSTITYRDRPTPAVFHNAFRATDGKVAVVLANATREPQAVTLSWRDKRMSLTLEADGALLVQ